MTKVCYTCQSDSLYIIDLTINNNIHTTFMEKTKGIIPQWFREAGIYSPLPREITCNPLYNAFKNPVSNWRSHNPPGADHEFNLTKKNLKTIGFNHKTYPKWMYFWGTQERNLLDVEPINAEPAYSTFYNSGLVNANVKGDFNFKAYLPTPYLVDNIMYTPHIHLAFLKKDNTWNMATWSITVFPYLDKHEYNALKIIDKYIIIKSSKKANLENIKKNVKKSDYLGRIFGKNKKFSIYQVPIIIKTTNNQNTADILLEIGFTNLLFY